MLKKLQLFEFAFPWLGMSLSIFLMFINHVHFFFCKYIFLLAFLLGVLEFFLTYILKMVIFCYICDTRYELYGIYVISILRLLTLFVEVCVYLMYISSSEVLINSSRMQSNLISSQKPTKIPGVKWSLSPSMLPPYLVLLLYSICFHLL